MVFRAINLIACEHCQRKFAPERLLVHQRMCTPSCDGFRPTIVDGGRPTVASRWPPLAEGEGDADPSHPRSRAANRLERQSITNITQGMAPSQPVSFPEVVAIDLFPCVHCRRNFALERLEGHQRVCAQKLAGFRATVAALEEGEREVALRQQMVADRARVELEAAKREATLSVELAGAEESVECVQAALRKALKRAEVAEATAMSMEAAHDVAMEAVQDGEKERALLTGRVTEAEAALRKALKRAEVAEATAMSMEAAHDVAIEAVRDAEARELNRTS
jgi:hypothetical protein|mmetsp:Transcript_9445/g.21303  ORF Transcript_9445/g.21303 Transcript_9445/m.21303 type:complete len:279 (-) Transcript_9445:322-1158(-)